MDEHKWTHKWVGQTGQANEWGWAWTSPDKHQQINGETGRSIWRQQGPTGMDGSICMGDFANQNRVLVAHFWFFGPNQPQAPSQIAPLPLKHNVSHPNKVSYTQNPAHPHFTSQNQALAARFSVFWPQLASRSCLTESHPLSTSHMMYPTPMGSALPKKTALPLGVYENRPHPPAPPPPVFFLICLSINRFINNVFRLKI